MNKTIPSKEEPLLSKDEVLEIIDYVENVLSQYQNIEADVYIESLLGIKIVFENDIIKTSEVKEAQGMGLRLFDKNGRMGFSYTANFEKEVLSKTIQNAYKIMKVATPDPYYKHLPLPEENPTYVHIENLFDKSILEIDIEDLFPYLQPFLTLKAHDPLIKGTSGNFQVSAGSSFIWNVNGIFQEERVTETDVSLEISMEKNGIPGSGFDSHSSIFLKDLDINRVIERSKERAKRDLNKTTLPTGKYPVILSPLGVENIIISPLQSAVNAEKVQNHFSFLENKMSTPIASPLLSINDDPHIPKALGSTHVDAEGVATHKLPFIEKGLLKNYFHNNKTARREDKTSNGHAIRSSYASAVSISPHNLIIEPGSEAKDDMISEIKKGIYFVYTGDHPNLVTGDFSGLILVGYLIEDGEITASLKENIIAGNLIDFYKNITLVSKEREWVFDLYSPWIKIENISVAGK